MATASVVGVVVQQHLNFMSIGVIMDLNQILWEYHQGRSIGDGHGMPAPQAGLPGPYAGVGDPHSFFKVHNRPLRG
jgi:hypothetical protein